MADDIYVQILKYVKDQPNGQVTLRELQKEFPDQWELINREVQNNRLLATVSGKWGMDDIFSLSFEDNFRLMEHEELVETRGSAKFAFRVAVISIGLNVIALLISSLSTASVQVTNLRDIAIQVEKPEPKINNEKK